MKIFLSIVFILGLSANVMANSIVAIGDAEAEKNQMALIGPLTTEGAGFLKYKWAIDIIKNDFSFYKKYFEIKSYGQPSDDIKEPYQVTLTVDNEGKPKISLKTKSGSDFIIQAPDALVESNRALVHQLSDQIYQKIVKKDSIFKSKIYFVCETKRVGNDILKELFVMDFDGENKKQLTFHNALVLSPSVSFDGKKVLYSLIGSGGTTKRNINLHMLDLTSGKSSLLSSKNGINSGAVFMPGDDKILLTLSHRGNADIYSYHLKSKAYTQITKKFSAEVDPSISVDGRMLTFLSDRPGKPMIYTMNPSGVEKNVKRIGWVGQYNATPRFSPDGKEIAFSSWVDNRFDIFRLNSDGSKLVRLTKNFGSNEDPTFSNEGNFVAFTSQRVLSRTKAVQSIYIMDRDGEIIGNFTEEYKICTSPRWSK